MSLPVQAVVVKRVLLPRADRYTVRVKGTLSWPDAHMAARRAVADDAQIDERSYTIARTRMTQRQEPKGYYVDEWTVTLSVLRRFDPARCSAVRDDLGLRCEMPRGHEGSHEDRTRHAPDTMAWAR